MARRRRGLHFGKEKKKLNISLIKEIISWIVEVVIVLVAAFVLVQFMGMRTTVLGQSMEPTLKSTEEVLVDKFIYKISGPKQDDIIVFLPNGNEKTHYYIKRVIAVPGDTVQIKNGVVYVNGQVYDDGGLYSSAIEDAGIADEEITVGEDEYFVLGDNINDSEDSRYADIGNIKKEYIIGKAWFIISPVERMGFIGQAEDSSDSEQDSETETE